MGSSQSDARSIARPFGLRLANVPLVDARELAQGNVAGPARLRCAGRTGTSVSLPSSMTILYSRWGNGPGPQAIAIDDPSRFKSSKCVGAHFGLTPTRYQSGETDYSGRISKNGDDSVRTVLYEAAHVMLTKPVKGCTGLKSWAMKIAKRAGMKKATVALARKLAVIMHRMLADGTPFMNQPA